MQKCDCTNGYKYNNECVVCGEHWGDDFTAGPWKIGVAGPNGCPTVGTTTGLMVCHIAHSINEDDQKSQALGNARLIKAAPEMFELLQECIPSLCDPGTKIRVRKLLAEIRGG